jgi:hypothetical protein
MLKWHGAAAQTRVSMFLHAYRLALVVPVSKMVSWIVMWVMFSRQC